MGELIMGRKDDGTLEIVRADDEVDIAEELFDDIPQVGDEVPEYDYYLENGVLKINASNGFVAYVVADYYRDTHTYRLVRTADPQEGGR